MTSKKLSGYRRENGMAVARSEIGRIMRTLLALDRPRAAIRGSSVHSQPARIHARSLELSYCGSNEPDNLDTFVASCRTVLKS